MTLPKINVGRFLRKEVAPLIPGGAEAAEAVNGIIKDVKGRTAGGQELIPATQAAIHNAHSEKAKREITTWVLVGAGVLVLVLMLRR